MVDELDLKVATNSRAPVLITAPSADALQQFASDLHAASDFASRRLTTASAAHFPDDMPSFQSHWCQLLAGAMGGTLFITAVDAIPRRVQDALSHALHLIAIEQLPVRVISGTTKPLFEQVMQGGFSEGLFYRLNVIHLQVDRVGA